METFCREAPPLVGVLGAGVSQVVSLAGLVAGEDGQAAGHQVAGPRVQGEADADHRDPGGGHHEGHYCVPEVEAAAAARALLQGREEGRGQESRGPAVEAGHTSLVAGEVAGEDAGEEEHEDGEDAEVAEVGDEDHGGEGAGGGGEDEVGEERDPVRDGGHLLEEPHGLALGRRLGHGEEGGGDGAEGGDVVLRAPPRHHQDVHVQQQLGGGLGE